MGRISKNGNPKEKKSKYSKSHVTKVNFSKLDSHTLQNLKKYYRIKTDKNISYQELAVKIAEKFSQQKVNEDEVIRNFLMVVKTLI
ncbi:sap30 [Anaeramoeba ignava]|uniref:Sap30 n=1 Tax=Anaeramoeba ignava TaxID=1746090 RepID=A0A9Q0LTI4_ANAIG|nr:sap30 [Anaeramoeba ignava]